MTRPALIALMLVAGMAATEAQQVQQPAVDSKACAPGDRLKPGPGASNAQAQTTGENLSDKLARTDGVICPPNVGPDMRTPAPETGSGTMPVIPPPGSPGGNPSLRPK
jgi:hypothetical protein